jgi:internalin A
MEQIRKIKKNSEKRTHAFLSGEGLHDLSFMKGNSHVVYLSAMHNEISNLKHLNNNKTVRVLCLSQNMIWDLSPLRWCNLTNIFLADNRIDDVTPLSFIKTLIHINVSFNRIQDVSSLSRLHNLKHLDVSNNLVGSIQDISQSPSINSLFISHNYITDVSHLLSSTTVRHCNIACNPIDDIIPKMETLVHVCHFNRINKRNLRITLFELLRDSIKKII